jgi:hypothetical protein
LRRKIIFCHELAKMVTYYSWQLRSLEWMFIGANPTTSKFTTTTPAL